MARRGEQIREFILDEVFKHPRGVVSHTSDKFEISRQAVSLHLRQLIDQGKVIPAGNTRQRTYKLARLAMKQISAPLSGLEEHLFWRNKVVPELGHLKPNVYDLWQYGVSEMVNNAVDHSGGLTLSVTIEQTAATRTIWVSDDGVGIFKKIQTDLHLEDERHAVLELAKGKLTTDPTRHTGEGIFFASRMFDDYAIVSGGVVFSHKIGEEEDWILDFDTQHHGTAVCMTLLNSSERTTRGVFGKYSASGGEYGFTRTVVPVRLATHGPEKLVSRSQAKRLLSRFDRFRVVVMDFKGVDSIGQAFADEVFRVFQRQHPEVKIVPANAGRDVKRMIRRARSAQPLPLFDDDPI